MNNADGDAGSSRARGSTSWRRSCARASPRSNARSSKRSCAAISARSIPRTSPSATSPTCTARRCRTWNFARKREPGRAQVRVFNPTIEEHGWQSTHTIIEIVNDDMPFLVDSVTMEVEPPRPDAAPHHPSDRRRRARRGRHAHRRRREGAPRGAARVVHPRRGRPRDGRRRARRARRRRRARARRRAARGRRLEGDARTRCATSSREIDASPPPLPPDELAEGRRSCAWLADNHFTFLGYRCHDLVSGRRPGRAEDRPRIEPRHPARDEAGKDVAASFAALPPEIRAYARRPELLVDHQVDVALDRASAGLSRLHRRQALRRRGQRRRRAPLPRPVHVDRVQRQPGRHSAAAPQDRQRRRARRARAAAATPARRCSTSSRPIRATSCSRRARTTCCARRWASCTWASGSAFACSCGAIRSSASCRASSTRRARTTRPSCARSGRRS